MLQLLDALSISQPVDILGMSTGERVHGHQGALQHLDQGAGQRMWHVAPVVIRPLNVPSLTCVLREQSTTGCN